MSEGNGRPPAREPRDVDVSEQGWGSDLIADVLAAYGFEYIVYNPGSSIRGLEESLVNYNDNQAPKTIEVLNEGLSASIAHGYAKATGEPGVCATHGVVGTLNGSMAIYAAYIDRVPVLVLTGNGPLRKSRRRPVSDWAHTHLNQGDMVSDFVKWHDRPAHSDGVVESLARAIRVADTPRRGPVLVDIDGDVQENRLESPIDVPDPAGYERPTSMAPDPAAVEAAADRLVAASDPVILASHVGDTPEAVEALVELSETLGAPVVESAARHRYNFPNTHPHYFESVESFPDTDLLLALDVRDLSYMLNEVDYATRERTPLIDSDPDLIDVGTLDLEAPANIPDYYQIREADLAILAESRLAIPALAGAVAERLDDDPSAAERVEDRRAALAERKDALREEWAEEAADAWDETPISIPRMAGELWDVVREDEWVIASGTFRGWTHRLWEVDEFDKFVHGNVGGGGIGWRTGIAIGAALAYQDSGRVPINIQSDGDLTQIPSSLWTVAHYDLPMFTVLHNNKTLYNSTNHRMVTAEHRGRDASYERALIGTGIWDPVPDYATVAEGFGVTGYGPIEDPEELAPTFERAWADVKAGEPVLVDVVSQAR